MAVEWPPRMPKPSRGRPPATREDDEDAPDAEAIAERLRVAAAYLQRSKPGKRSSALSALWLALTGVERDRRAWQFGDNSYDVVARHYGAITAVTRAAVGEILGAAYAVEPDPACRGGMIALLEHCEKLEGVLRAPPSKAVRGRRRKPRPAGAYSAEQQRNFAARGGKGRLRDPSLDAFREEMRRREAEE